MLGCKGKRLIIDLSTGQVSKEEISEEALKKYLGGRGLNVAVLAERLPDGVDPLSPENILCFGAGLLTGTSVPSSGRYNVTTKSPASGFLGDANAGGFWAPELKYAGYSQLLILGKSSKPVYIHINNDDITIRDASHLWGEDVWETEKQIKTELDDNNIQIASIGQAGENLIPYAAVMNNLSRAAARTGIGAVMGSKNLKAISVRGTNGIKIAHPQKLRELNKKLLDVMYKSPSFTARSSLGTSMLIELYNGMGVLPTKNMQESVFSDAGKISGKVLLEKYKTKSKSCFGCPLHCSHYYHVEAGEYGGTDGEGPEFETLCSFGSKCGNSNMESILFANNLCNQYGLDTISTGASIAFAMECYEKGLLSEELTGGLQIKWGDHELIISLIHKIAKREGFGDFLAKGVSIMSSLIPGSESFALHIKGVETPEQEIRGLKSWGLGWAVSSRGGDHCRAFPLAETTWKPEEAEALFGTKNAADRFSYDGKPEMVKWYEEINAVGDSLEMCRIAQTGLNMPMSLLTEIVNAVTGWDLSEDDIMTTGERIIQLERVFNLRNGMIPADDRLPERFLQEELPSGPGKGERYDLKPILKKYYGLRHWDPESGWPSDSALKQLGIVKSTTEEQS